MIPKPTRLQTLFESFVDIAIGYCVALLTQVIVFPIFDIHVSFAQNNLITVIFTLVSLTRTFVIRRAFIYLNFGRYARLKAMANENAHLGCVNNKRPKYHEMMREYVRVHGEKW